MKYYIIAGEASGDLHGSNLIAGLRAEDPNAQFRFWGGDLMLQAASGSGASPCFAKKSPGSAGNASQGELPTPVYAALGATEPVHSPAAEAATLVRHYKEGAVMGLGDVLGKAGKLLGNISFCKSDILGWTPDVVVLIDYPGFNMKIAKFCHARGIRVFYYIAPKTWASRESRNRKLRAWVDKLFIVFPFEIPYFTEKKVPFIYKGNPLIDAVDSHEYTRPAEGSYIALLPGSRKGEISRMMPVCMEVADRLGRDIVIAGAPARSEEDYKPYIGSRTNVKLVFGKTYDILKFADAAIINSGTASLEAALIGTPQVVCWSTGKITAWVAKHVLRVLDHIKYISLGNLCIDRFAFRELIQDDFTVDKVARELDMICNDAEYREKMISDYGDIRKSLGGAGASRAVAKAMIEALKA